MPDAAANSAASPRSLCAKLRHLRQCRKTLKHREIAPHLRREVAAAQTAPKRRLLAGTQDFRGETQGVSRLKLQGFPPKRQLAGIFRRRRAEGKPFQVDFPPLFLAFFVAGCELAGKAEHGGGAFVSFCGAAECGDNRGFFLFGGHFRGCDLRRLELAELVPEGVQIKL